MAGELIASLHTIIRYITLPEATSRPLWTRYRTQRNTVYSVYLDNIKIAIFRKRIVAFIGGRQSDDHEHIVYRCGSMSLVLGERVFA